MATAIWFRNVADVADVEDGFASGTLAGVDVTDCEIYAYQDDVIIIGTSPEHASHGWIDGDVVCALTANDADILIPTLIDLGASWLGAS
jgi:hypothetical protein